MSDSATMPVIAGLTVGSGFIVLLVLAFGQSSTEDRTLVTITGEVVCLPHKESLPGGSQTDECAVGFYGKYYGRYYGLNATYDDKIAWLFHTEGSGELLKVTGILKPASQDSKYDISGVIDIISVSTADGSTSIYEVFSRHFGELAAIVEEIQTRQAEDTLWGSIEAAMTPAASAMVVEKNHAY